MLREFEHYNNNREPAPAIHEDLIATMLTQTKETPLRYKTMQGRFLPNYLEIWKESKQKLHAINPSLPIQLLTPKIDMAEEYHQQYEQLPSMTRGLVWELYNEQKTTTNQLVDRVIVPALSEQALKPDLLTTPTSYHPMTLRRTCFLASYSMVFETISGHDLPHKSMIKTAKELDMSIKNEIRGGSDHPDGVAEDTLLAMLQTPSFQEHFGDIKIGVVKSVGVDFDQLTKVITAKKQQAEEQFFDSQFFYLSRYASAAVTEGWHSGVLLSADIDSVRLHDPSQTFGGQDKRFEKDTFSTKWGKAHLRGDLIMAFKPKS